jgi:hypothetical protein
LHGQAYACACFCCSLVVNGADHYDQLLPLFVSLLDSMPVVAVRALLHMRISPHACKREREIIDNSGLFDTPIRQQVVKQLYKCTLAQLARKIPRLLPFLESNSSISVKFVLHLLSRIIDRGPSESEVLLESDLADRLVQLLRQRDHPGLQCNTLILCAKLAKHLAGAQALLRARLLHKPPSKGAHIALLD